MRTYIATKFENTNEFYKMRELIQSTGHTVTHDWTTEDWAVKRNLDEKMEFREQCAILDFQGVVEADALILIQHEDMKGAYVELGIALANNKHVIIVGGWTPALRHNIFYEIPGIVHVQTMEDAHIALDQIATEILA